MSEEFDKEAEREKLREKLEKDEQKRQETQRMSELLLQGATMTNEHCENCGDPLFRDGEETFCPTCRGSGAGEQPDEAAGQPQQAGQQTTDQPRPDGQQASEEPRQQTPEATRPAGDRSNGTAEPSNRADVTERVQRAGSAEQSAGRQSSDPAQSAGADPRAELQRAVTRAARKANEATDPRTAKQWLEASKEAAEALEALER
ncbi:hypothetical protein B4589_012265 [Halolamina sp. CBA1230]|uniref:Sjogren's syndrome/scleroderma autoantigen 1 family protein n=1 Tax=Halolamina sp. CBA1230 TaxID=1853690 RepID=UPI0009A2363E|nr:Sjogren's syndrome/scleroderma autoantigen 1 family protein [Halolamina sp. CBA1230]QKY21108.1 hypothetical protein B4589_012265 [Halolamina sp. CBA1230]